MNEAARLITLMPRRQNITNALITLHWLPIQKRINSKSSLLRSRPYMVSRLRTSVTYSKTQTSTTTTISNAQPAGPTPIQHTNRWSSCVSSRSPSTLEHTSNKYPKIRQSITVQKSIGNSAF